MLSAVGMFRKPDRIFAAYGVILSWRGEIEEERAWTAAGAGEPRPAAESRYAMSQIPGLHCLAILLLFAAGCARTPAGITGPPPRQLILTMTVAGIIVPEDFYY